MEREQRGNSGGGDQRDQVRSFEDMKVWQEAHQLVQKVLSETPKLPSEQQEGIALMMEKSAIEVPRYVAEGFKRRGSRNKAHYYDMARSSLEGLRYLFILCRDMKYGIDFEDLSYRGDQVSRMLDGLVRSMVRTSRGPGMGRGRGRGRRDDGVEDRGYDSGPDEIGADDDDLGDE
jgi:four helix bundle protein